MCGRGGGAAPSPSDESSVTSLLTNNAAMTALTTLKSINTQLDAASNRVSTGQRVSSAADNAAYWSIATTVRTDNASLSAVKDSLGLASSTVDTTKNGLNSIITDLQNMRAKLQTALQPGVDRAKVQTEITAIQNKMKSTADSSVSSGQNWLSVDSSASNTAYQATQNVIAGFSRTASGAITYSQIKVDVAGIKLYDVNAASASVPATSAQVTASTALSGTLGFGSGAGTADFSGANEVAISLNLNNTFDAVVLNRATLAAAVRDLSRVTVPEFVAGINNQIAASPALNGRVRAFLDDGGRLGFATTRTGAGETLRVGTSQITPGHTLIDIGFGAPATLTNSMAFATTPYVNADLSGSNAITITVDDGITSRTVTVNASSLPAPANPASVTFTEMQLMMSNALTAAGSTSPGFGGSSPVPGIDYFVLYGGGTGPASSVTISGPGSAALGFTNGQVGYGSAIVASGMTRTATGTDPTVTTGRGILDTAAPSGFSIASMNISNLVGTTGDVTLAALITQVDRAITSVTNAGTRLGANKTQIDGQKAFVDTLMKANDRTIGILVDADTEEESTRLKALQIQQLLAVQALGIANGGSATVLRLFQ